MKELNQLTVRMFESSIANNSNSCVEDDLVCTQRPIGWLRQLRTVNHWTELQFIKPLLIFITRRICIC